MDDESNRLAGLLNISTPANPGKPAPWTPPPDGYHVEPAAAQATPSGPAAQAHGPRESQGPAGPGGPQAPGGAPGPSWPQGPSEQRQGAAEAEGPADRAAQRAPDDDRAASPPWDPTAVSEIFSRTVAAAQAQQAQLEQAMAAAKERTYVGESADGDVRVTVDGRPRVTEVYVSARAVREGPGPLGAAITEAANAAVRVARQGANEAVLDGLDPAIRTAIEEGLASAGGAGGLGGANGPGGSAGAAGSAGPAGPTRRGP